MLFYVMVCYAILYTCEGSLMHNCVRLCTCGVSFMYVMCVCELCCCMLCSCMCVYGVAGGVVECVVCMLCGVPCGNNMLLKLCMPYAPPPCVMF